jgi:hypothetical protein
MHFHAHVLITGCQYVLNRSTELDDICISEVVVEPFIAFKQKLQEELRRKMIVRFSAYDNSSILSVSKDHSQKSLIDPNAAWLR